MFGGGRGSRILLAASGALAESGSIHRFVEAEVLCDWGQKSGASHPKESLILACQNWQSVTKAD